MGSWLSLGGIVIYILVLYKDVKAQPMYQAVCDRVTVNDSTFRMVSRIAIRDSLYIQNSRGTISLKVLYYEWKENYIIAAVQTANIKGIVVAASGFVQCLFSDGRNQVLMEFRVVDHGGKKLSIFYR